jgi:hypothetical protein
MAYLERRLGLIAQIQKERETAVANTPCTPDTLVQDLKQVHEILEAFFSEISASDWQRHTEPKGTGWTLFETLAHVTAAAETLQRALEDTLSGVPFAEPRLESRTDLPSVLQRQIKERKHTPPTDLIHTFLETLEQTAFTTKQLTSEQLQLPVDFRAYNRPLTVAELIGVQLVHPGIVHAAQLANGAGVKPLWQYYSPKLMQRQMTHFFHLLSHCYWQERGGDLNTSINYIVSGAGGGRWYVTMSPDGGSGGDGRAPHPALTIWTPSADALCRIFTFQINLWRAILTGRMVAWGNVRLGFKLPYLFKPT